MQIPHEESVICKTSSVFVLKMFFVIYLFSPRSLNNLVLPNALETLKTQNNNENIISWSSKYTEREVGLVGVNGVKVHPIMEIFCRLVNRTQTKGTPTAFFSKFENSTKQF
jgi:hypothetical protein